MSNTTAIPMSCTCSLCKMACNVKIAKDGTILASAHPVDGTAHTCDGSSLIPASVLDQYGMPYLQSSVKLRKKDRDMDEDDD